ncbi:FAD-binding oxidoreductase [Streptomyces sp. NPDC093225]|uniref:FAD-binding oxidoreductase n=1 Tax=Streptomyces sp. NPDC093225 TaxID=3366034 RepID=UPI00382A4AB2
MGLGRRQLLAAPLAAGFARGREPDLDALARGLDGRLVRPGEAAYAEARRLFQPRHDAVAPAAVAYPAHEDDVVTCLDFARRAGLPVVARGGGHSYPGWSTGTGLVVDVGLMAAVEPGTGSARIGAGARLGEVHAALGARGAALPAGLCPSVGIAGLTLGGGLGVAARAYGATSDALTGARVVTPDGRVREVGPAQDAELFWALRGGGGGNFGVVTEFRFRTWPAGDCGFAELHWPASATAGLVGAWQRWLAGLADPFWSQLEFTVDGGDDRDGRDRGPNGRSGGDGRHGGHGGRSGRGDGAVPAPAVRVVCLDGRAELEEELDRLAAAVGVQPRDRYVVRRGYADTMRAMAGCLGYAAAQCRLPGTLPGHDPAGLLGRDSYAGRSDFWTGAGLPPAAVAALLDALAGYPGAVPPGGRGVVQLDGVCGGALNRVGVAETAFAHRSYGLLTQYLAYWPAGASAAEAARHEAWLGGLWSALRPWASGAAYQNYADPALTDWRGAYYGPNLARLEALRRALDPDRLFRFPQAL